MDLDMNSLGRPSNREVLKFGLYLDIQDDAERAGSVLFASLLDLDFS